MNGTTTRNVSAGSTGLESVGAVFCLFLSLLGAGLSGYLTLLKFRMIYTPCLTDMGSCKIGEMSCGDALASSWSMLLKVPISLWGTAFYLLTAVLAATLLGRRKALGGGLSDILLVCALFAVLVTLLLGGYTLLELASPCPFCLSLYAVSVLLLVGAQLAHGRSGVLQPRVWLGALRRDLVWLGETGFYATLAFIVLAGSQSMAYHGLRRFADSQEGCPEPVRELPLAMIRAGDVAPQAIVVMFIDMTCSICLEEFKKLGLALQAGKFPMPVQLWIYHTPRQACDPTAFPAGYPKSDDNARYDDACLAARAAECMEKLQPGTGFSYIGGLFALHEERMPNTPLFTTERAGNKAVDLDLGIDPDDNDNALFRCIRDDTEVLARITEHQQYAETFKVPAIAVYQAKDGEPDLAGKPFWIPASAPLQGVFDYASAKASATK